jgi:hypothetical protein
MARPREEEAEPVKGKRQGRVMEAGLAFAGCEEGSGFTEVRLRPVRLG